ncbi:MAG: polysaccharide export protein [Candidatus Amulumruptor caecigallinarius]|nr:polysaccharide export protein [Candidatus Amulumruptor caecigallinarius]
MKIFSVRTIVKSASGAASACLLFLAASCSTPKDVTYFQDIKEGHTVLPEGVSALKVAPEDKLSIIVTTQDPNLSAQFNLVMTQSRIATTRSSVSESLNVSDSRTGFYTVNADGDINFPVLGKLHVAGMTRSQLASYIEKRLISEDLVKDPVVTVEFINTGVSVLGEVHNPGRYEFNKDRVTVLDALALAGDMRNTGMRTNVKVIRDNNGQRDVYVLDLTNAEESMKSPGYYVQQNDMIYVEPNERSKRETTSSGNTLYNPSFWVSLGSVGITVATLVVTISK